MTRAFRRVLLYGGLALAAGVILLPVVWMVSASLKPEADIIGHPGQLFPTRFTSHNFHAVMNQIPFARQFLNTVIFAGGVTLVSLTLDAMTAFALARLEFPGRRLLFVAVILFLMIPFQVTLIPIYQVIAKLGLINTFPGLIIFFLRQFFIGIPRSLDEAARIDGAGDWRIFARIILPLSKPALLTLALFHFMYNWNDLLWPLIFTTGSDMRTLPAGLALFMGQHVSQYGALMAGATLAMLPMLVAFLFVQRKFIQGIATTGLK
jgi:multiple sugar transport system permease protein